MAKIVIAGRSDCPYFARCELLGDRLARNLHKFKLHKIVVQPAHWERWLTDTCTERGWTFTKSPIIWRELIDRGGKGVLIGDSNDFQEYAKAYYDVESVMNSSDMQIIASENKATKDLDDEEVRLFEAKAHPVYICITSAESPVCYHLLNSITKGQIFSQKDDLIIRLLVSSTEHDDKVRGYAMEVEDLAHGALKSVEVCYYPSDAFADCSVIILLDSFPRLPSEQQPDWLKRNADFFLKYATFINTKALKSCKILVCGDGPMILNAMVVQQNAPTIPRQNIVAVSTILENQAKSLLADKLRVNTADISGLIVWGNLDFNHTFDLKNCKVYRHKAAIKAPSWVHTEAIEALIENRAFEFTMQKNVANRTRKVMKVLGGPTSLSMAASIYTTLVNWLKGSGTDRIFSLGVCSEGSLNVPAGLFCSLPVQFHPRDSWNIVTDVVLTERVQSGLNTAVEEIRSQLITFKGPSTRPTPSTRLVPAPSTRLVPAPSTRLVPAPSTRLVNAPSTRLVRSALSQPASFSLPRIQ